MLRISMFSSSPNLRHGLHRAVALLWRAAHPLANGPWWSLLPDEFTDAARAEGLGLVELRQLFLGGSTRSVVDIGARRLDCSLPESDRLDRGFADAILSAHALALHGGRDVYGSSNKWLWDSVVVPVVFAAERRFGAAVADPDREDPALDCAVGERLRTLSSFDTSPEGNGHAACVEWLQSTLKRMGFSIEVHPGEPDERPIIVARRGSRGGQGHVVLYGHYDVTAAREQGWTVPPEVVTERDGRWFGRGVGDDKGPLACRLAALEQLDHTPALTWVIQGEEETGSPHAHRMFPALLGGLRPTIWLEETGYHDHDDRTLRLIARIMGEEVGDPQADPAFSDLLLGLRCLADAWSIPTRPEVRGLNKDVATGGCPFNRNIHSGARYIALGVNDTRSRIHGVDESIPRWTLPLHRAELALLFDWVDRVGAAA
jgi:hypothetical protein